MTKTNGTNQLVCVKTKWIYEANAKQYLHEAPLCSSVCSPSQDNAMRFLPIDNQHVGGSRLQRKRQKDKNKLCVFSLSRQCNALPTN